MRVICLLDLDDLVEERVERVERVAVLERRHAENGEHLEVLAL
ncbi:hypothetical protein P3T35_007475 [Kitasatospora sp. GP30]|nr:hypothetical protein [Kitasatospora sp. GP30]MDH6145420.1 hypothetical protein [Kitasatospora sp. GP30]